MVNVRPLSRFTTHLIQLLAAVALGAGSLTAHAVLALEGRDINGNPVAANDTSAVFEYDPNLDLTWLRDWNVNGARDWGTQVAWAAGLTVGTFSGWSLPTIDASDTNCSSNVDPGGGFPLQYYGDNCTGSAMGYLWYTELANAAGGPLTNTGPFLNMQSNVYWSGTEYAPNTGNAWDFYTYNGFQIVDGKNHSLYAVAVRPGDVAASAPEPGTVAMLLAGLGALAAARRRRPR